MEFGPLPVFFANSSLSVACALSNSAFRFANSSSLSWISVDTAAGRCIGICALAGQRPCRSGSPHGVFGGVNGFVDLDCAKAGPASSAAPIQTASQVHGIFMEYLLGYCPGVRFDSGSSGFEPPTNSRCPSWNVTLLPLALFSPL